MPETSSNFFSISKTPVLDRNFLRFILKCPGTYLVNIYLCLEPVAVNSCYLLNGQLQIEFSTLLKKLSIGEYDWQYVESDCHHNCCGCKSISFCTSFVIDNLEYVPELRLKFTNLTHSEFDSLEIVAKNVDISLLKLGDTAYPP